MTMQKNPMVMASVNVTNHRIQVIHPVAVDLILLR